jgi:hypothetical protein
MYTLRRHLTTLNQLCRTLALSLLPLYLKAHKLVRTSTCMHAAPQYCHVIASSTNYICIPHTCANTAWCHCACLTVLTVPQCVIILKLTHIGLHYYLLIYNNNRHADQTSFRLGTHWVRSWCSSPTCSTTVMHSWCWLHSYDWCCVWHNYYYHCCYWTISVQSAWCWYMHHCSALCVQSSGTQVQSWSLCPIVSRPYYTTATAACMHAPLNPPYPQNLQQP